MAPGHWTFNMSDSGRFKRARVIWPAPASARDAPHTQPHPSPPPLGKALVVSWPSSTLRHVQQVLFLQILRDSATSQVTPACRSDFLPGYQTWKVEYADFHIQALKPEREALLIPYPHPTLWHLRSCADLVWLLQQNSSLSLLEDLTMALSLLLSHCKQE